ncbi:hypothetical protein L1887_46832 [Cichorium endivia]|nr:hypothetical protein L1887_46832 [Cichorium endivia]
MLNSAHMDNTATTRLGRIPHQNRSHLVLQPHVGAQRLDGMDHRVEDSVAQVFPRSKAEEPSDKKDNAYKSGPFIRTSAALHGSRDLNHSDDHRQSQDLPKSTAAHVRGGPHDHKHNATGHVSGKQTPSERSKCNAAALLVGVRFYGCRSGRTPLIYAHKKLPAGNIDARPRQPMTVALGSGGIYEILAAGAGSAKDEELFEGLEHPVDLGVVLDGTDPDDLVRVGQRRMLEEDVAHVAAQSHLPAEPFVGVNKRVEVGDLVAHQVRVPVRLDVAADEAGSLLNERHGPVDKVRYPLIGWQLPSIPRRTDVQEPLGLVQGRMIDHAPVDIVHRRVGNPVACGCTDTDQNGQQQEELHKALSDRDHLEERVSEYRLGCRGSAGYNALQEPSRGQNFLLESHSDLHVRGPHCFPLHRCDVDTSAQVGHNAAQTNAVDEHHISGPAMHAPLSFSSLLTSSDTGGLSAPKADLRPTQQPRSVGRSCISVVGLRFYGFDNEDVWADLHFHVDPYRLLLGDTLSSALSHSE